MEVLVESKNAWIVNYIDSKLTRVGNSEFGSKEAQTSSILDFY